MNGYKAFHNQKTTEIWAPTSYDAQKAAAKFWGVKEKNRHQIAIVFCQTSAGETVTHQTSEF